MKSLQALAVAVDLDGTMIDTESEICAAVNDTLIHFGRAALGAAHIVALTGKGAKVLIESALHQAPIKTQSLKPEGHGVAQVLDDAVDRFKASYRQVLGTKATVYDGVYEGLALLRRRHLKTVCVTNKPVLEAEYLLKHFKLYDFFDAVVAPQAPDERKPSAYLLQKAAGLLAVAPTSMVLIGDSNNDVLSARRAGVAVIRVATGYERHLAGKLDADLQCAGFLQAAQAIGRADCR